MTLIPRQGFTTWATPLTLVAENSTPASRTVAARPVQVAQSSVPAVVASQAAVVAKGVLQADCKKQDST